jgi:hypothetical protein
MGQAGIGPSGEGVGDDRVREATGRGREGWFGLLDEAGAGEWTHAEIAAWLSGDQGVDAWWSQHVTVAYEQARGIRAPGQRQDGLYEASVSRTVALDAVARHGSTDPTIASTSDERARLWDMWRNYDGDSTSERNPRCDGCNSAGRSRQWPLLQGEKSSRTPVHLRAICNGVRPYRENQAPLRLLSTV